MATKDKLKELVGRNIGTSKPTVTEPKRIKSSVRPTVEIGTKEGDTRATFIVSKDQVKKMKYIAMMSDRKIKDELAIALEDHIAKWEKAHGEIPTL